MTFVAKHLSLEALAYAPSNVVARGHPTLNSISTNLFVASIIDMPNSDDSTLSTTDNYSDSIYFPTTSDKEHIIFLDNDATIEGTLYEIGRHYKRSGLFQMLFNHHAVSLSNGKLAVDSNNTVYYTSGKLSDPHSFDDPCPPTAKRFAGTLLTRTTAGSKLPPDLDSSGLPESFKYAVVHAPHLVDNEDAKLLRSLLYVFGQAESVEDLIDAADGSGLKLLEDLRARATHASPRDKALVSAVHARIVREGVVGELTLKALKAFLKAYKAAKRNLPPAARLSAEAETEMLNLIAAKCPLSRDLYDLRTAAAPPATLDAASSYLIGILRGRERAEQIDEVTNGAKPLGLAAELTATTASPAAGLEALTAAIAALGPGISPAVKEALAATIKAVSDPRKNGAGRGNDPNLNGVVIPRDKDGKPSKWIEGMALCKCGVGGGKHLFKDCPKKAEEIKKKTAAAAAKKAAETAALAAGGAEGDLAKQLAALLASISPAQTANLIDLECTGCAPPAAGAQAAGSK